MKKYIVLIVFFTLSFNPCVYSHSEEDFDALLLLMLDRTLADIRQQNPRDIKLEYRGRDFSGLDLSSWNFGGANFINCNFSGCDVSHSDFSDANLNGCDFRGCVFDNTQFGSADLRYTRFFGVDFSGQDLSRVNLAGAWFIHCDFSECDLTETNFQKAVLRGSNFRNCTFGATDFRGADLRFTDFRDRRYPAYWQSAIYLVNHLSALFQGADLSYANFCNTRIDGVVVDERTKVKDTLFIYTDSEDLAFLPSALKKRNEAFVDIKQYQKHISGTFSRQLLARVID